MSSSLGESVNIELVQSPKEVKVTDSSTNSKHQQTVEETKSSKSSLVKSFNNSHSSDSGKSSSCSPILLDCSFDSGIAGVLLDSNDMQIHKRIQQCQCILLALERDREYYCTIRNRLSKFTNRKKKPSNENEFFCNVCCADIDPEDDKTFVKCYICQKYICRSIKCADWLPKTAEWECELCQTSKESLAQTSSWVADQISFHQEKLIHPPRARSEIYIPISECNDSSIHFESVSQIGANSATVTADQKHKIREYVEEVVAKLLGGNLDTIAVNQLSKSENYLPDPKIELGHNGISPESVRVKASNNDFTDISETRLRQMIQKIIAETMNLPPLSKSHAVSEIALDRRSKSGDSRPLTNGYYPRHRTEHYFEPIIYQDLLATAVLNKIVDGKLNNNHEVSESDSGGGGDEVNDNVRHAGSDQNLNIEKLSTSSGSSVEPRSDCSYPEIEQVLNTNDDKSSELIRNSDRDSVMSDYLASHMIPLPDLNAMATESEEDDYMSVTSSAVGDGTWEKNWLFKKKKSALSNSVTTNSVGILVPDPKEDVRAQIGDKTADEVSDLSELGSDTDDSLDSLRSKLEPINDRLINKHLIGGQNNKMVLDELIERSSMISNTLQSSQDPSYTDACNEHVIDGPNRNEAINDNVTQQASTVEQKGDILRAALCSVVLEDPNSNTITASDDNSDSDGCTGFSAIEIIEPTPSVVEILAAMALGPMLAVPSVDQPAPLTVTDFNVFTDLKELALAEIKARSLELTPRNLDVIPEETGDTTNSIESIIDSKNISTSDETNERLAINLTIAPELEFNTIGINKEILDINSSEISSTSPESIICTTDGPVIEATDVSARNKTSVIDTSTITLTKDQELKDTSAYENISYSLKCKSTKFVSEKSHLDIDENTAAVNMEKLNEPISKDTELSVNDIGIKSKNQLCETYLQKTSDYNSNENLSESVALKGSISEHCLETLPLSAAIELPCTSELINNAVSLVLADKTDVIHEQILNESRSEIKLQDIPDSINNETLSSQLESDDQANSEMHINNESNNQCHVGENNLVKYSTQHSEIIVEQNSSEITLQDTSDTTYNKTACSIQSNTMETLSATCSKGPEKNTSNDNDSEKTLQLNEMQQQGASDYMNSEALSITEENTSGVDNTIPKEQYSETQMEQTSETAFSDTNVESKTENNITDGNVRVLEETSSKEQTCETQIQQNEIVTEEHCSYIPLEANTDSMNSEALSASSNLNMSSNIEDSRALDDTVSEMMPLEPVTEQKPLVTNIQSEPKCSETNTENNTLNDNSETQLEENEIVLEEPNVESKTQDIPSDLNSDQQTIPNDNVEEQFSNIQQVCKSECTNIEALTSSSELNVVYKPEDALNENSRLLNETTSKDQCSEIQMVQNKAVLQEQSFDISLNSISDSTKGEPSLSASLDTEDYISNKNTRVLDETESKEQSSEPQSEHNEIVIKQEASEIKLETRMKQNEIVSEAQVESKNYDNISKDSPDLTKIISNEQSSEIPTKQNDIASEEQSPLASSSSESNMASKTKNNTLDDNFRVLEETISKEQPYETLTEQNEIVSKEQSAELQLEVNSGCMEIEDACSESIIHPETDYNTSDKHSQGLNKEQSSKILTKPNEIISEKQTSALSASLESNTQFKTVDNTSDEKSTVLDDTIYQEQSNETQVKQNEIVLEELISALPATSEANVESKTEEIPSIENTIAINDITSKLQNEIDRDEQPTALSTSSESTMESKTEENTPDEKSSVFDETVSKKQVEQNDIVSEEPTAAFSDSSETTALPNVKTKNDDNTSDEKSSILDETLPKEQSIETPGEQNEIVSKELNSALSTSSEEQPLILSKCSESNMESKTSDETIPKEQANETQVEQNDIASEKSIPALAASADTNVESKTEETKQTDQNQIESDIESKPNEISSIENTIVFERMTSKIQNEIVSEEQPYALSTSSETNTKFNAGDNASDEKSSFLDRTIPKEKSNEAQEEQNEIVSDELTSALLPSSERNVESKNYDNTSDEKSSDVDETIPKYESIETKMEQNDIVSEELTSALSASSELNMEPKAGANTSDEKSSVLDETILKEQSFETQMEQNEIVSDELTSTLSSSAKVEPSALSNCSESTMESKTVENASNEKSCVHVEEISEKHSIEPQVKQNEIVSDKVPSASSTPIAEQPSALSNFSEPNMESKPSNEISRVLDEAISKEQSYETQVEQNKIVLVEPTSASSEINVESKITNKIVIDDIASKIQNEIISEEQPSTLFPSSESNMESKTGDTTSDKKSNVLDETIPQEQSFETQVEQNELVSEELTSSLSAYSEELPSTLTNSSESNMKSKTSDEKSGVLDEVISKSIEPQVEQNEIVSEELTLAFSGSSKMVSKTGESTSDEKSSVLTEAIPQEQSIKSHVEQNEILSEEIALALSKSAEDHPSTLYNSSESNMESKTGENTSDEKASVLIEVISQVEPNKIVSEEPTSASSEINVESKTEEISSIGNTIVIDDITSKIQNEIISEEQPSALSSSSESNMESKTVDTTSDEQTNVLDEAIPPEQANEPEVKQYKIISEEPTSASFASSEEPPSTLSNCSESTMESKADENTSDEKSSILEDTIPEKQSIVTQAEQSEIVTEEPTISLSASSEEHPLTLSNSSESNMESKTSDEKSIVVDTIISKNQPIETQVEQNEIVSKEPASALSASSEDQPLTLSKCSESNMESKTSDEKTSVLEKTISKEQSIETQVEQTEIVSEKLISGLSNSLDEQPSILPKCSELNMESKTGADTSDEKSNILNEAILPEQANEPEVKQNEIVSEEPTSASFASSEEPPSTLSNCSDSYIESKTGANTSDEKSSVLDGTIPQEQSIETQVEQTEIVSEELISGLSDSLDEQPSTLPKCSESNMESKTGANTSDEKSSVLDGTIPQEQSIETQVEQTEIVSEELISGLSDSLDEQPSTLPKCSESNMESKTSDEKSSVLDKTISKEQPIETQVEQNKIVSEEPTSDLSASLETNMESKTEEISSIENIIVINDITSEIQNEIISEEQPSALSSSSESNMESKTVDTTSDEKSNVLDEVIPQEQSIETQVERIEFVSEELTLALSTSAEDQPSALSNSSESNMESKTGENTSDEKSSVLIETIPQEQSIETHVEQNEILSEEITLALSKSAEDQHSTLSNSSESNMESKTGGNTSDEKSSILTETISKVEQNKIVSEDPTSASSEINVESKSNEISSIENTIVIDDITPKIQNEIILEEQPSALSTSSESNMESKTDHTSSYEKSNVLDEAIPQEKSIETQVEENEIVSDEVTSALSASAEEEPSALSNSSESNMESKTGENTSDEKSSVLDETISKEQYYETQEAQNKIISEEPTIASSETNVKSKTEEISSIENTIVIDDITSKIQNEIVSEEQPSAFPSSSESNMESKTDHTSLYEKPNVLDEVIPQEKSIETQVKQNELVSEELSSALSASSKEQPSASLESNMESKNASDVKSSVLEETISEEQSIVTQGEQNEIVSEELTSGLTPSSEEQPLNLSHYSDSNMEPKTGENTSDEISSILAETISQVKQNKIVSEEPTSALSTSTLPNCSASNMESKISDEKSSVLDETVPKEKSIETQMEPNEIVSEELTLALSASAEEQPLALSSSSKSNMESKSDDTTSGEKSNVHDEAIHQEQSVETQGEQNEIVSEELTSALSASSEEQPSTLPNCSASNMESKISDEKSSVLDETTPKERSIETQVEQNEIVSEEPTSAFMVEQPYTLPNSSESNMESKTGANSSDEKSSVLDETIPQEQSIETQVEKNEIVSEKLITDLSDSLDEQPSTLPKCSESNMESKTSDEKSSVLDKTISKEQHIETQVEQNKIVSEEPTSDLSASLETNMESKTEEISSIENIIVINDITSEIQNEIISEEQPSALFSSSESNMESKTVDTTSDEKSNVLDEVIPQEQSIETQMERNEIVSEELTLTLSTSAEDQPSALSNSSESNMESKSRENTSDEKSSDLIETIPQEQPIETHVEQNEILSEEITLALSKSAEDQPSTLSNSSESNMESKTGGNTIVIDDITPKIQNEIILEEQPSALSTSSESTIESKSEENTSDEKSSVLDETIPKEQMEQNDIVSEEPTAALSASSKTNVESKTEEISSTENTIVIDDITSKIQNEIVSDEQPSDLSTSSESNMESKTGDTTSDKKSIILDDKIPQEQSIEIQVEQNEIVSSASSEEQSSALPTSSESNIETISKEQCNETEVEQNEIVSEQLTSALSASSEAIVESKTEQNLLIENTIVFDETSKELNEIVSESNIESKPGDNTDEKSNIIDETISEKQSNETLVEQKKIVLEEQPSALSTSSESNMESKTEDNILAEQTELVSVELSAKLILEGSSESTDTEALSANYTNNVDFPVCSEDKVKSKTEENTSDTNSSVQSSEIISERIEITPKEQLSEIQQEGTAETTNNDVLYANSESNAKPESEENTLEENTIVPADLEFPKILDEQISKEQPSETLRELNEIISSEIQLTVISDSTNNEALFVYPLSNMQTKTEETVSDDHETISRGQLSAIQPAQNKIITEEQQSEILPKDNSDSIIQPSIEENTSDEIQQKQNEIISEENSFEILNKDNSDFTNNTSCTKEEILSETSESSEQPKDNILDEHSKELDDINPAVQYCEIQQKQTEIILQKQSPAISLEDITKSLPACSESSVKPKTEANILKEHSKELDKIISKVNSSETQQDQSEISSKEQSSKNPIESVAEALCTSSESTVQIITEQSTSNECSKGVDDTNSNEQSSEKQQDQIKIISKEQPPEMNMNVILDSTDNESLSMNSESNVQLKTKDNTLHEHSGGLDKEISEEQSTEPQEKENEAYSKNQIILESISESTNNEDITKSSVCAEQFKTEGNRLNDHSIELDKIITKEQSLETQPEQNKTMPLEVNLGSTDLSDCSKSCEQYEIGENISNEHSKVLDEIICKDQHSEILQEQNQIISKEQTTEMPLKDISNHTLKQQSEIQSSVMQLQDTVYPMMNEAVSVIPETYVQTNTEENSSDECSKVLDEIISKEQSSETQQEQIEVVIKEQQSEMPLTNISNPTSNEQNEIVSKEQSYDIQPQITLDPMNNELLTDSSESKDEHLNLLNKTVSKEQSPETVLEQTEIISKEKLSEISLECNSNFTHNETLSENSESNAQSTIMENIFDGQKDISNPTVNEQNELVSNTQSSETLPVQNEIISKEQSSEILLECNSNTTSNETLSKNSVPNILENTKALDDIISKEQLTEIQPKQYKIVLSEKSSEIALENIDSTHNELLKESIPKEKSSESQAEQKDIVLKEQSSDIQLQTNRETTVQPKAEGNTLDECSKECNEIILEIQHSEIKLEQSAEAQLKFISEHKNNESLPECLSSNVQLKTEENNLTECSKELDEQISKEHLSILDKHEIADSSKHEALTKDSRSNIQCKSADEINMPTTNTTPIMPSTTIETNLHTPPVPTILSESEYNPKLASASENSIQIQDVHGMRTEAATLNILEEQISLDDSPTISRQSTVVEIEEDNNKAAANQPQDQLSYDSKPYADSRTNTIEEYIDNENDEKDILAINYNNNSTTNTITTITTTTTNSSTETNAKANTNHNNTNNHKQPITNMSGDTATTTSNQMRSSDPLTSAVQNNETSSHSPCVQQLIRNDRVNVQILTDVRDKNNIDGVGVNNDGDLDDGVIKDYEEEDDDDDVAILRHFLPGSIAEREYKKWYNAVEMPNNPYAPEALKRRISGSQERFIDLPNISPTKDLNPLDLLDNQQLEADENKTRESDYKRYSRDYYINSSLTTPQLSPARDVAAYATKKDIREPTKKTLSSTENETELDLYKAIPAQVVENNSSSTDVMSPLSGELDGNTTTTSDDSDTIKMYDFKTQQETIKDATITHREQARVDAINSKERPSSLAFSRSESSVNIVTPTRGSTPMAFKFLQPKRKLLEPNQVLSVEENEPQIVSSPSEKPVIEAEVAKALPSVKALARAFLMTTKTTQPEKLWLRKARTLSQGGSKRSYSPKRSLDHLMKSERSKPEDDITITSDLSSLETDSSSIGIQIATTSDVSTPAISSTDDPSHPTDTGNISPVPVRQGVLKNNIAFFENLKNK